MAPTPKRTSATITLAARRAWVGGEWVGVNCTPISGHGATRTRWIASAAVLGLLAFLSLLGNGCNRERGPSVPIMTLEQASRDPVPRTVRIEYVWDMVADAVQVYRDPQVSHLVEVAIISGPGAGTSQAWPWDGYYKRAEPPGSGRELVAAPADWVVPARPRGRPIRTPTPKD